MKKDEKKWPSAIHRPNSLETQWWTGRHLEASVCPRRVWLHWKIVLDEWVAWLHLMAVFDDCIDDCDKRLRWMTEFAIWWLDSTTWMDGCVGWRHLTVLDNCVWWPYSRLGGWLCGWGSWITVFGDCVGRLCLMPVFDDWVDGWLCWWVSFSALAGSDACV